MKKAIRIIITSIICIGLVVGYYYWLSNRNLNSKEQKENEITELEKIEALDLDENYPKTPRSVVKNYNRMIKALYDQEPTEEDIEKVGAQIQKLFDEDLVKENPKKTYIQNLKADVSEYKDRQRVIIDSDVSDTAGVTYATKNGSSMAYVNAYYFIREGSEYQRTYQKYALRKDKSGNWKILTFKVISADEFE